MILYLLVEMLNSILNVTRRGDIVPIKRRTITKTVIKPNPNTEKVKINLIRNKELLEDALSILDRETIDDIFCIGEMLRNTKSMIQDCE